MLGDKLRNIFDQLGSKNFITETVLAEISKEIQKALIVSDVNINLVLSISKKIKSLKGEKMPEGANEKEYIIKRIHDLLVTLFSVDKELPTKPRRVLLCGLYGAGKTTTTVKLANFYKKKRFSVGIVGADVYRMAAYEQLVQLATNFEVFGNISKSAGQTAKAGIENFKDKDIIIIDSAGRSALDGDLKKELSEIVSEVKPEFNLLVMSADMGQIALTQAQEFNKILAIDGIILTKMDGSAKGGGALAACASMNIPIFFIGQGEKVDDLQEFDATRYLSSIMGYGDLQGLLEKISGLENPDINLEKVDFETFKTQLNMTKKIGGIGKIAGMLGLGKAINSELGAKGQEQMNKFGHMIDSMTKYERKNPEVMSSSRITRIAKGSGTSLNDVRLLIKQRKTMSETMDTMKGKDPTKIGEKDIQGLMQKQMKKKMRKKLKIR